MASGTGAYIDMLDAVKRYYGTYDPNTGLWSGSDQWEEIAKHGIRPDNVDIVKQVEGVDIIYNADGSYRSWNYNNPFSTSASNIAEEINSNTQSGIYGTANTFKAPVPVNTSVNASTGNYDMVSGSKSVSTGANVSTIARTVSAAATAISAGCRLGKFFAQETYNQNPDYWDEQLPTMNPETWNSLLLADPEDDPTGLYNPMMQWLFGLDPDTNETTAYMDEDALAYMAYAMKQLGMFGGEYEPIIPDIPENQYTYYDIDDVGTVSSELLATYLNYFSATGYNPGGYSGELYASACFSAVLPEITEPSIIMCYDAWLNVYSTAFAIIPISVLKRAGCKYFKLTHGPKRTYTYQITLLTDSYEPLNYSQNYTTVVVGVDMNRHLYVNKNSENYSMDYRKGISLWCAIGSGNGYNAPAWISNPITLSGGIACQGCICDFGSQTGGLPEGVSNQPDYVNPDTSTWTDPETTKQSLKQQHPEWWDGAIYNDVPQPDGTNKRYTYVPVPTTPTTSKNEKQPTNTTVNKNQTKVNPNTSPDDVINTMIRYITDSSSSNPEDVPTTPDNPVDNPPDTGDGDTPTVVVPTGNASALWSVYNPSQAQLDSFGSWLWSSDFFSQLKKLFNDPMQAIIGVHKVFATPQVSGQSTIKCGYIDSEVPSNVVGSQYVTVNCGSVSLREYFGNVFDYAPYTEVKLFLPFIGVVPLDTAYVMRGSISVTYHVDVITGACLAEVSVRRDSAGGIIYTFGGSCIVQYPVSSGSYMSVISGVLGTVASGVMAGVSIGTGNVIGAVYGISGAAQSILNTHTNVQHSGGFTGCTGAMGGKKPYLIISRPQTELNGHEPHMSGLPSNDYITLSSRSGFIRCKHVHVAGIDNATASEKDEIERLLKQGVLI